MSVRNFYRALYAPEQMQQIDSEAITGLGIPSAELMEQAGRSCAQAIGNLYREWSCDGAVLILCGPGNNGGDGLVIARHLAAAGIRVRVRLFASPGELKGDAALNFERARAAGIEPISDNLSVELEQDLALVVDALLGTGARGGLRAPADAWATALNASELPVIAVDAPSGVELATGRVPTVAMRARATLALAELKPGYFLHPGREHAGDVYLTDIGIPAAARKVAESDTYLITPAGLARLLPERPVAGHKGTFGKVAVIGGSVGMTGAPVMASEAALRGGCGLVTLGVPAGLNDVCETLATEVITRPLPELRQKRCLAVRSVGAALQLASEADVCVLGCGAGRHHETQECVGRLVERIEVPLVLDADGLFAFGSDTDRLVRHGAPMIITPHAGELARLLGTTADAVEKDRIAAARRAARHFDCVCVLKGACTVVGTVTGQVYLNPTGNSGLATAGSGDVLAGLIGSLIAQGMSMLGAATAGVYLHGLAGDLGAHSWGERGLVAGDIIFDLPQALRTIEDCTWPEYF